MIRRLFMKSLERHASKWVVLAIDLGIIAFNFLLAYAIRLSIEYDFFTFRTFCQLLFVLLLSLSCFLVTGSYKGVIRQTGLKDVYKLAIAIFALWGISYGFVKINRSVLGIYALNIPVSIVNLYCFLSLAILIVSRALFKHIYNYIKFFLGQASELKSQRVLIFGNGDEGIRTLKTIVSNSEKSTTVIGFIDDDKNKIGRTINGIKVYDIKEITPSFLAKKGIEEIIISNPDIKKDTLNKISDIYIELGIKVKIVPNYKDWINGKLEVSQIKQIQIEDLLERSTIKIQNEDVPTELNQKVIFITGAAGSIGSEIVRQLSIFNYKQLILIDQAESPLYDLQQDLLRKGISNFKIIIGDIRDPKRMEPLFNEYQPDFVFHAAAYKHVPLMEEFPAEAVKINILGTCLMADLSMKYNVDKFVFISTDKAVNPTNVMGATKRAAEIYLQLNKQSKTKFITTRFGNVLGSAGSVIPLFKKQIEMGGPITVTHKEILRYFMTIPEASQLVIEAMTMGEGGEIFIFDMGKPVKIYELAKKMIHLSGLRFQKDIDIQITGLRPGEKLYEELLANVENTEPTYHHKIMIHKSVGSKLFEVSEEKIKSLRFMNLINQDALIVRKLKEIVPEFASTNPKYQKNTLKKISVC